MFIGELKASSHSWLVPLLGHSSPHELLAPCWLGLHVDAVLSHPAPNYQVCSFSVMITVDPVGWRSLSPSNVSEWLGFPTQSTQCFFTRPHMACWRRRSQRGAPVEVTMCPKSTDPSTASPCRAGSCRAASARNAPPRSGNATPLGEKKRAVWRGAATNNARGYMCKYIYIYQSPF